MTAPQRITALASQSVTLLNDRFWACAAALKKAPPELNTLPKMPLLAAGLASLGLDLQYGGPAGEVTRLADSVADLEYGVRTHELFKRWCSRWLTLHIVLSVVLYVLLGLHIWAGIHFGLRWFA